MKYLPQRLGKIEKPEVKDFANFRRLFCVPLIPYVQDKNFQEDLKKSIDTFWKQVAIQITDLEKTGRVSYIFFESITSGGKKGLEMVKNLSQQSYNIVKEKIDGGAKLVQIENEEILNEFLDWSICLSVIQKSQKVFKKVLEYFRDISKKRNEEMAKKIDATLNKNQSGLLIMTDENRLQVQSNLPSDIQIFLVHPPALNDIIRYFREYWKKQSPT